MNIVFRMSRLFGILSYPLFGFIGAMSVIFLIYILSIKRSITKIREMLLTLYDSDLRKLYQLTGIRFRSREESEYIAAVGEGEQKFTD